MSRKRAEQHIQAVREKLIPDLEHMIVEQLRAVLTTSRRIGSARRTRMTADGAQIAAEPRRNYAGRRK